MLATLREMGEKEGVKFNEEQYQKALPLIKTQAQSTDSPRPLGYERVFPRHEYDERKRAESIGNPPFGRVSEEIEINIEK